ncbi:mechanosensitive ion channel [Sphingosinicella sp. LY1275]|uniref:mechanosensitive ion channel n=1 Tax=Sphingosinicella sp. LY1275 TaxID=3095379 RepID=UPI002ADEC15E|nr:mechanosensitive ion channel [Sphingosinicella sp. LY1275]MEA1016035.1 mechanosensitive ion channel [Sphingosinicella sp. LY1275]
MYGADPDTVYWQQQAYEWVPRILGAIAILVIAYILARAAKWAVAKMVDRIPALQRHNEAEPGKTLGSLIGDVAFWLILLVGILLALQPLGLSQVLEPVRELTTNTFAFIPNVIAAGLIFFIGLVIAKIARRIVEGSLLAANADGWLRRTGLVETAGTAPAAPAGAPTAVTTGRASISRSVGMVVFFLIMIPVTIAALEALKIAAISEPATEMLRTILDAIPNVLGAAILIAIGFFLGKLAKQAVEQLLPSLGFDRAISALGFSAESTTPSRTVGTIVLFAILIFFAIKAAELLDSAIIAMMLAQVLELGSRILFGTGIILGGVIIARIVSNLVSGAGTEGWLPAILKWSIIALAVAMGLRFMGLANEIVIIAFGSIIGSAAVACALAFGLGGRPTAHKLLERWTEQNRAPVAPRRPRTPTAPASDDLQPPLV